MAAALKSALAQDEGSISLFPWSHPCPLEQGEGEAWPYLGNYTDSKKISVGLVNPAKKLSATSPHARKSQGRFVGG